MSSFSGVVALADDPESAVAATVEVNAGMLTLTAGGSEIGAWGLDEIRVEQTAGAFNLRADGEDLVLTTPDMAGFADAVGVVTAAEPKREKRRRFGFLSGRDRTADAEPEPASPTVAVEPPPPPPPPPDDPYVDPFTEPIAAAALDVEAPDFAAAPDPSGSIAAPAAQTDLEPGFSTTPDQPAFPVNDGITADRPVDVPATPGFSSPVVADAPADDVWEAPSEEPIERPTATAVPFDAAHAGFAAAATDDSPEVAPLASSEPANGPTPMNDPVATAEAAGEPPVDEGLPDPGISFAPAPELEQQAPFDRPQPAAVDDPGFDLTSPGALADTPLATPEPSAEPTPEPDDEPQRQPAPQPDFWVPNAAATAVETIEPEPAPPVARSDVAAPDLAPSDPWRVDAPAPLGEAPTDDVKPGLEAWGAPEAAIGRWPEPDLPPAPAIEPDTAAPEVETESHEFSAPPPLPPLGADEIAPPVELGSPGDEVPDAAGRDVPAIAGIAAVGTPDRYVTVEPEEWDEAPEERPDHGADMATEDEIAAWIGDVKGDNGADEQQPDPVVPSRFETLRNRSAENYSDESVLSVPLTMAMFLTAVGLVLGTLLSWGVYALSDSLPVERLVSAVAAFAVAGGAYLGYRQDRRIAGSIIALGGGVLALAAVYAYAREAQIGIGFLLATAGAVAAVALGIVGVTRFGHGPDPRIRD